jgi:DNA-binding CsgD family transcriptional regulator
MEYFAAVPWRKVHDYLLQVESCETINDFMHTACVEVAKLIYFDAAAGIWSAENGTCLEVVGPLHWRSHRNLKLAVDFVIPDGLSRSFLNTHVLPPWPLAELPEQRIVLAIFRTRSAPDFTSTDGAILDVLNQHLRTLFTVLNRKSDLPGPPLSLHAVTERFRSLSRREAELCCLLARRLNTAEIAEGLFISRRTVEKHIDNIFDKLNVRSRAQLRTKMGVQGVEKRGN